MTKQGTAHKLPSDIHIRDVESGDMAAICAIYSDEVLTGVSSWEYIPPTLDEITTRKDTVLKGGFPYRVATKDGTVIGYAYASPYRPREGYRFTVENSVYVSDTARGLGVGRLLIEDLVSKCETLGYRQMIAVIGSSANQQSILFHQKMGFDKAGVIKSIEHKFDRWMDSVIMQRTLGDGDGTPPTQA